MARRRRRRRSRPSATEARARVDAYYRRVADALIEQIERGTAPWTEAWKPGERALPYNVKSGKAYRGGNSVWLASTASRREYSDERWGTYRQVKELGGQVRRGQKGCKILYWQWEANHLARDRHGKPLLDEEGRPVHETRALRSPRVYQYTVFNAEQCDGLPPGRVARRRAPGTATPRPSGCCAIAARSSSTRGATAPTTTCGATAWCCRCASSSRPGRATTSRRCTSWGTGRGTRPG